MVGDYVIRGVHGEFYPCKPEIFKKTYEEISANEFFEALEKGQTQLICYQ